MNRWVLGVVLQLTSNATHAQEPCGPAKPRQLVQSLTPVVIVLKVDGPSGK